MTTLKYTIALIAFFTLNKVQAQTMPLDSVLNLEVSVIYNSNASQQVPTIQNMIFLGDSLSALAIAQAGNGPVMPNTYIHDPATAVFSFSLDSLGNPTSGIKVQSGLSRFYNLDFGFSTNTAATISVTATFTTVPNGNYCAYLKRLSTGEVFPILNDTMTINIPVNATFATDFIFLFGPTIAKTINYETCYGDGLGGVDVSCKSSDWNYRIYDSGNNLILQENVFAPDTTINQLAQGNYTIVTSVSQIVLDSASFVVAGPAPLVALFSVSDYLPIENTAVNFTNSSFGATTYAWDFGDGDFDNAVNSTHAYAAAGIYTITLTAYNGGCSNTITDSLEVLSPTIAPPNTIMQDPRINSSANSSNTMRDGMNQELTVATAMQSLIISVKENQAEMTVEILNMNGQLISSEKTDSNVIEMKMENPGVYLLRVTFANGEVVARRVAIL